MKFLNRVRINIFIISFILAVSFMFLAFNVDFIYKSLYNIGVYDGKINNISFALKSKWYLCESTEEGVLALSEYEFPMVTYCDDYNGKLQFFPWLEQRNHIGEIKSFNNIKLSFLRYIEQEDKVMFLHNESMIVVTASPSSAIEDVIDIMSLAPEPQ